jgi:hypothetical protein
MAEFPNAPRSNLKSTPMFSNSAPMFAITMEKFSNTMAEFLNTMAECAHGTPALPHTMAEFSPPWRSKSSSRP